MPLQQVLLVANDGICLGQGAGSWRSQLDSARGGQDDYCTPQHQAGNKAKDACQDSEDRHPEQEGPGPVPQKL